MFDNLSDKLQRVFKNLRGEGKLSAENMECHMTAGHSLTPGPWTNLPIIHGCARGGGLMMGVEACR